jgi:hypothetical protein
MADRVMDSREADINVLTQPVKRRQSRVRVRKRIRWLSYVGRELVAVHRPLR